MAVTFLSLPATASKVAVSSITTFNGIADAGGAFAELGKVGWGVDGTYTDVTAATPLPAGLGAALTSAVTVMQNAAVATGPGTSLAVTGYGVTVLQISGTFVASIAFEASVDAGATWVPMSATQIGAGDIFTVATVPGVYRITSAGMDLIRARVTWTSGTVTVNGRSSNAINASKIVKLATSGLTIGKVGIDQSTPGTTNAVSVTNASFAVTGTFFQATQPVSIAANTPDVTDRVGRLLGQVVNAGTFAVQAAATLAAETTKVIGTVNVSAAQSIAATQATAANLNMTATPIALTKGTQGAAGFTTQDLKDAGRNLVCYYTLIPVLTTATDTLQSLTGTKGGATVVATTTPAVVTTGKNFRVSSITATYIATAVSGYAVVRVRAQPAGVASITSNVVATFAVGSSAPGTANAVDCVMEDFPDGSEFAAGVGIGISVQGFAAVTATAVGYVMVSLNGYEY